jgi:aryl-alcohol dehydrogenase-like predicted oxidoreductase
VNQLGKTGAGVDPVSLGGEGILRTQGRAREAVPMILAALEDGVRYCDTAPAYAQSQDYYGEAFRQRPSARDHLFMASKTHERDKSGATRLLEGSLKKLGTDRLDLWQMHDLRTQDDLDEMFAPNGAIEAAEAAKKAGKVRFVGLTGHQHPEILLAAMRAYDFDTVLLPINPADRVRLPFLTTVIPEARARNMGVIGMKVMAAGLILSDCTATAEECSRYAMAFADTLIIGCSAPEEVRENLRVGREASPMTREEQSALEGRFAARASRYAYFKA